MRVKFETRENGSLRVGHECIGEGKTEQAHRDQVNINSIMRRYQKTRLVPQRVGGAYYGDFSAVEDYHSALEAVRRADEAFMTLPAEMRLEFDNDPHKLLSFLSDEQNREKAMDLGLIERPVPEPVPDVPDGSEEPSE